VRATPPVSCRTRCARPIPVRLCGGRRSRSASITRELSARHMQELDALDRSGGTQAAFERKWW